MKEQGPETGAEAAEGRPAEGCEGLVFDVDRFSVHDGPGIRTTVFLKGCPLRCRWCHSPESQEGRPQLLYQQARCISCHTCAGVCPAGAVECREDGISVNREACRECFACTWRCPAGALRKTGTIMKAEEIIALAMRDRHYYLASGGGITLSGGEPLAQPAFSAEILHRCHLLGIHTTMETCGYGDTEALTAMARDTNLILYDIKILDAEKHRAYTGVSNERILRNLWALCAEDGLRKKVYVRMPLIPGVNDSRADVADVASMLRTLGVKRMDVLPYNPLAAEKYAWIGKDYPLGNREEQAAETVAERKAMLSGMGFTDQWGGEDGTEQD